VRVARDSREVDYFACFPPRHVMRAVEAVPADLARWRDRNELGVVSGIMLAERTIRRCNPN
jgi:hypothetical protein